MKTKTFLRRCVCCGIFIVLVVANAVHAQVSTINSANINPRAVNDIPGATLTTVSNYPALISFNEQNVSQAATVFERNQDRWNFSNNGGTSAYAFANNDFFQVSMTLTLTASAITPRKEAGFLLSTIGGDGQFIVNTDGHEVVAFGGPLPFYAFPSTFDSGETITLGMNYFLDGSTGKRSIIYSANGVLSPVLAFSNTEHGIIDGSTLGGYFQIVNDPANPSNSGSAVFANISIVPEPSALVLLSLGILPLGIMLRNRRVKARRIQPQRTQRTQSAGRLTTALGRS